MGRRSERMAQDAALEAEAAAKTVAPEVSEAARVLAQSKTESVEKPIEKPVTPRNDAYTQAHDEIEKRHRQTLGLNEDGSPIKEEEPAAPVAEEVAAPEPVPTVAEEAPQTPSVETVRVKVDGEEFDVPKADIEEAGGIRAYQTAKAADNRLKKSNQELAEIRKTQAAILEWATKQAQPTTPQVTDDQFIAQKMDAIRYGTPEEGATAMREILQRSQQKFDPNAMTAQAVMQMTRKLAVDRFREEFTDIATNPDLLQFAAVMETQALSQVNPNTLFAFDWNEHYRNIGNKIRSIVGKPNQPTTATQTQGNTSQPSEKEARKASITVLPTSGTRASVPVEKELTPDEYRKQALADMQNLGRKLRGESTG